MAKQIDKPANGQAPEAKRFEIRTPAAGFNGERAGVLFRDGIGVTDNAAAAAECARLGYAVRPLGKDSDDNR